MSAYGWTDPASFERLDRDRAAWEGAVEREASARSTEARALGLVTEGQALAREEEPARVSCMWCGTEHPEDSDMTTWECCATRTVWAEGWLERQRLTRALSHALAGLVAVAECEEWRRVPFAVRFDLDRVRDGLRIRLEAER